jgi:hypothetical protein
MNNVIVPHRLDARPWSAAGATGVAGFFLFGAGVGRSQAAVEAEIWLSIPWFASFGVFFSRGPAPFKTAAGRKKPQQTTKRKSIQKSNAAVRVAHRPLYACDRYEIARWSWAFDLWLEGIPSFFASRL